MIRRSSRLLLEVAVASADDVEAASGGGADRVELNSALWLGGLTPSLGTLIESRARATLPIIAMIRPRGGGFAYTNGEFAAMLRDVRLCLDHGADGIAFGILTDRGEVDADRCGKILELVGPGKEAVFHRAFDVVPDPFGAMETLIALGVRRIMTSGQEESAYNGAGLIAELIRRASGRVEILPAGGINRFTLADVVERTSCDQVHASLKAMRPDGSTAHRPRIGFGGVLCPPEDRFEATDRGSVEEMRRRIDGRESGR